MGVQKVVERCEVAKENGGIMDLSGCHLFHDERHTINCLQSLVKCYHQNSTQIPKQFQLYHRIELISQQNVNTARRDFQMYSTGNYGHSMLTLWTPTNSPAKPRSFGIPLSDSRPRNTILRKDKRDRTTTLKNSRRDRNNN